MIQSGLMSLPCPSLYSFLGGTINSFQFVSDRVIRNGLILIGGKTERGLGTSLPHHMIARMSGSERKLSSLD